jgi:hypothetical protein
MRLPTSALANALAEHRFVSESWRVFTYPVYLDVERASLTDASGCPLSISGQITHPGRLRRDLLVRFWRSDYLAEMRRIVDGCARFGGGRAPSGRVDCFYLLRGFSPDCVLACGADFIRGYFHAALAGRLCTAPSGAPREFGGLPSPGSSPHALITPRTKTCPRGPLKARG